MTNKKETSITTPSSSKGSLALAFRIVFSNLIYIIFAAITAIIFWIVSSIFDQLLFFYPITIFYLPDDAIVGFILINIIAILLGIVVSMNIYVFRHSKIKVGSASLLSGSSISLLSSLCISCSSIGFFLISTLGAIGVTASAFVSNNQTPLRLLSITLLMWAYYSISNKLTKSCMKDYPNDSK